MNTKSVLIASALALSIVCHGSTGFAVGVTPDNHAQKLGYYDAWQKFCKPNWTADDRAKIMRYNHIVESKDETFFRDYFLRYHAVEDNLEMRATNPCPHEKERLNESGVWF